MSAHTDAPRQTAFARAWGRETRGQIIMLFAQFLLGMAVNLIGLPSEATDGGKAATSVFLALHVLVAVGLVVGAIRILRLTGTGDEHDRRLARAGAAAVVATFVFGVLDLALKSNWWSYAMAVGFVGSLLSYGMLMTKPRVQ